MGGSRYILWGRQVNGGSAFVKRLDKKKMEIEPAYFHDHYIFLPFFKRIGQQKKTGVLLFLLLRKTPFASLHSLVLYIFDHSKHNGTLSFQKKMLHTSLKMEVGNEAVWASPCDIRILFNLVKKHECTSSVSTTVVVFCVDVRVLFLLSECLKKCCSRKYIVARVLAKSLCAYFD
jgi:hypothetical protein